MFLTNTEKDNLAKWEYKVEDKSITTKLFNPFWNRVVTYVPLNVAPNVISLVGLICIFYAYYLSTNYQENYPLFSSIMTCLLTFTYFTLDSIDGKQARRTKNSSPLGELFDHSCDNVGTVFIILSFCNIMGITLPYTQWFLAQTAMLIFLDSHVKAFIIREVKFGVFSGPGEILILYICAVLTKSTFTFGTIYESINYFSKFLGMDPYSLSRNMIVVAYFVTFAFMTKKISQMKNHYATRNGLLISLAISFIPSLLIITGMMQNISTLSVVSGGLIMAVVTGDMIVAKMANRELHPLIPVFVMSSLFSNFLSIAMCIVYYTNILLEISFYLNIPLLSISQNVFCNGVYDLLHEGHMNLFKRAATYGTKLKIGVHNDEDCSGYKRKPYRPHEKRCELVGFCKFVDEVIPNVPLYIDEAFIKTHNIHIVVCSAEYDKPDDLFYAVPRKMGILRILPRHPGISTSDIIKLVKN